MAKDSIKLEFGGYYRVHHANGTTTDFKALGEDVEIIPSRERVTIHVALGVYLNVEKIDCQ